MIVGLLLVYICFIELKQICSPQSSLRATLYRRGVECYRIFNFRSSD